MSCYCPVLSEYKLVCPCGASPWHIVHTRVPYEYFIVKAITEYLSMVPQSLNKNLYACYSAMLLLIDDICWEDELDAFIGEGANQVIRAVTHEQSVMMDVDEDLHLEEVLRDVDKFDG